VYASRLIYGGSYAYPNGVFGSQVSLGVEEYAHNFKPDLVDLSAEDAWYNPIYAAEYEEIHWLMSEQVLLAGCTNGIWRLGGPQSPIQGTTSQGAMIPLRQSSEGVDPVTPVMYGGLIVYVERGGRRIRGTTYSEAVQKYATQDLLPFSYHLTESGVVQLALQRRPWMIVWAVTRDGHLLSFSFSQQTGVSAWSKHSFSGVVESVEVIPKWENDEIWISVKREIDGATVRHIEYLEVQEYLNTSELNFVDSFVRDEFPGPFALSEVKGDATVPAQVTASDDISEVSNGDYIRFRSTGYDALDGEVFVVQNIDTNAKTFELSESGGKIDARVYLSPTAWDQNRYYFEGDVVEYSGSYYFCEGYSVHGSAPDVAISGWRQLSAGDVNAGPATSGEFEVVRSGLNFDHLNGKEIHGLIDETTVSPTTAASDGGPGGQSPGAAFDRYGKRVIAGLPFYPELQTLNIAQQPMTKKRVSEIYLNVLDSGAVQVGPSQEWLETVIFNEDEHVFGDHTEVYTGDRIAEFPGTWSQTGSVYVTQNFPLPLTLVSFVAEVTPA